jgi:hypothetical protein
MTKLENKVAKIVSRRSLMKIYLGDGGPIFK